MALILSASYRVQGYASSGSTASGNPVLIGGVDTSGNARSIYTDTSGRVYTKRTYVSGITTLASGVTIGSSETDLTSETNVSSYKTATLVVNDKK